MGRPSLAAACANKCQVLLRVKYCVLRLGLIIALSAHYLTTTAVCTQYCDVDRPERLLSDLEATTRAVSVSTTFPHAVSRRFFLFFPYLQDASTTGGPCIQGLRLYPVTQQSPWYLIITARFSSPAPCVFRIRVSTPGSLRCWRKFYDDTVYWILVPKLPSKFLCQISFSSSLSITFVLKKLCLSGLRDLVGAMQSTARPLSRIGALKAMLGWI